MKDCASLVRFAYREALAPHDGAWAARVGLPEIPAFPSLRVTIPAGQGLFEVPGGERRHFADAETLRRVNTFRIGKDVKAARPGDLLFYEQPGQEFPNHVMVFLGASHFEKDRRRGEWVVYHTGPVGAERGEIRRVRLTDLLEHREPRWRPQVSNPRFLGVYRWNILRAGG